VKQKSVDLRSKKKGKARMVKYTLNILVLVVVAMMVIAGSANAVIIDAPGSGGGSGGGGSVPFAINQNFSQHLYFPGISLSASGTNYLDSLSVNASGYLEQGVNGRYYLYDYSNFGIHVYEDDPSRFSLYGNAGFRIVSEDEYVPTLDLDIRENMSLRLFDEVDFYSYSTVENREKWFWEETSPGEWTGYSELTDDFDFSWYINLELANLDSLNFDAQTWEQNWGGGEIFDVLGINFSAQGHFIPEPASMILLGLGAIPLIRRRRRR